MFRNFPYWEKIGDDVEGQPDYIWRLHLTPYKWWPKKWSRIYLHVMGRPDDDRELHDHPWGFRTIVLWGGYDEVSHVMRREYDYVPDDKDPFKSWLEPAGAMLSDRLGWLSTRYRPAEHAHLITKLHTKRVVTLVFRDAQRSRNWGFWCQVKNPLDSQKQFWKWVANEEYRGVEPRKPGEAY